MNGKKAKLLRKMVNFKPSEPRSYTGGLIVGKGIFGNAKSIVTTQKAEGARRQYQAIKRRGMTNIVLGAQHA